MATTTNRPVHLNLLAIRFPVPAVMSIGHRIGGVLLIFATPALIYLLGLSLSGGQGFDEARDLLAGSLARAGLFLLVWALMHHLLAGIRYLALDLDVGIEREAARASAWGVLILAPVLAGALVFGGLV